MKVVLDFDDTIFNTYKLVENFLAVFEKEGFTREEFSNAYQISKEKTGDFDVVTIVDLLSDARDFNRDGVLLGTDSIIKEAIDFIYLDFFDFARKFGKENLILLSHGKTDFQRKKIENSKINDFFKEIIVTQKDKIENLKKISKGNKNEKIFFIDDKAEEIDKVKETMPEIITMKMQRPQGRHVDMKSKLTNYIIQGLYGLDDIIK